MLKHILFDNDGTIVDSEILAVRSTLQLMREYGLEMDEETYTQRFPGLLERDILAILKAEYGLVVPQDYLDRLRQMHIEVFKNELKAIDGMPEIFRNLKVPKSMVSNGSVRHVEYCLKKVDLHGALDGQIFSAEQVEKPKPHPAVYHHAMERLGLQAEHLIVVEDSPTGVLAAKAAGLRVAGFLGASHVGVGHEKELKSAGADYIFKNAIELKYFFQDKRVL